MDIQPKKNTQQGGYDNAYRVEWEHKDGWTAVEMAKLMKIHIAGDTLKLEVSAAYADMKKICQTCLKLTETIKGALEDNMYCSGHGGGGSSAGAHKKASAKRAQSAFEERNRKRLAAAADEEF